MLGITGAVLVALPRLARGRDAGVALSVTQCAEASIPSERLLELARAELAPRTVRPVDAESGAHELVAQVRLCDGSPDRARLIVRGHRVVERTLDLSGVDGDARARTVAVALAEIAASVAREDVDTGQSTMARGGAPLDGPPNPEQGDRFTREPPLERTRAGDPTMIGAGLVLREHILPHTLLLGPGISLAGDRLMGEVLVVTARHEQAAGTVEVSTALGGVALTVLGSRGAPSISLRIRAELGVAWASGTPATIGGRGQTAVAPQGDAQLEFALRVRVTRKTTLELRVSSGYASGLVAESNGVAAASTHGVFLGATLAAYWGV
jgi:hypothetical protein